MDLLAQQGAVPLDQLARFLDHTPTETQRVVAHLVGSGYANQREILVDEPAWVWLTGPGTRVSGTGLGHYKILPGALTRLRAVNEVRLYLAEVAPQACWTSNRQLQHIHGGHAKVPNAMLEIDTECHAIEVRVNNGNLPQLRATIEERCVHFDAVVCFCTPQVQRFLERMKEKHGWRKVLIRRLPGGDS